MPEAKLPTQLANIANTLAPATTLNPLASSGIVLGADGVTFYTVTIAQDGTQTITALTASQLAQILINKGVLAQTDVTTT